MSEFDPTTNRVQFKLMTKAERAALYAWRHGWEYFGPCGWEVIIDPTWFSTTVYRGLPKPVVTSERFNVYPQGPSPKAYSTREKADDIAGATRIAVLRIDTCNGVSTAHLE